CSPRVPPRLRHGRKTRYGWVARPYPTGTCTLQETPSFSWRENARRQVRGAAAVRNERRLFPVACTPKLDAGCGATSPALHCPPQMEEHGTDASGQVWASWPPTAGVSPRHRNCGCLPLGDGKWSTNQSHAAVLATANPAT